MIKPPDYVYQNIDYLKESVDSVHKQLFERLQNIENHLIQIQQTQNEFRLILHKHENLLRGHE